MLLPCGSQFNVSSAKPPNTTVNLHWQMKSTTRDLNRNRMEGFHDGKWLGLRRKGDGIFMDVSNDQCHSGEKT